MPHYIEESINPSNKIILELNCNNKVNKSNQYYYIIIYLIYYIIIYLIY